MKSWVSHVIRSDTDELESCAVTPSIDSRGGVPTAGDRTVLGGVASQHIASFGGRLLVVPVVGSGERCPLMTEGHQETNLSTSDSFLSLLGIEYSICYISLWLGTASRLLACTVSASCSYFNNCRVTGELHKLHQSSLLGVSQYHQSRHAVPDRPFETGSLLEALTLIRGRLSVDRLERLCSEFLLPFGLAEARRLPRTNTRT